MTQRINTTTSRDGLCRFILQIILLLTDLKVKSVKHDSSLLSISCSFPSLLLQCCFVLFCFVWIGFLWFLLSQISPDSFWLLGLKTMNYGKNLMIHSRFDSIRFIHILRTANSTWELLGLKDPPHSSVQYTRYRHNHIPTNTSTNYITSITH